MCAFVGWLVQAGSAAGAGPAPPLRAYRHHPRGDPHGHGRHQAEH